MTCDKKKVVFIGPFGLEPKGTMSVRALPMAKALAARGHSVTVLIPPWDDPDRSGQSWVEEGVTVVNVSLPPRLPVLFHLGLTGSLVRRALALQPDVIHFFKPKAYAGLAHLALWWLKRLKALPVRLVVDADDWEQAWNEVMPYSSQKKGFFAWQEKWGLTHADSITVASRTLERLVIAQTQERQPHVFYVPNGYYAPSNGVCYPAPERHAARIAAVRQRWQLDDAPVILLYSRFMEFRLARITSLVGEVAARLPQVRWLFVGSGLQREEERLAVELDRAGLKGYVRFTGWIPADQLPDYFAAATVAIHPYDDTLINRAKCSVKLIDLLSASLPVVADGIGQNNEYIQNSLSGVLVPPEDDAAFAEALIALLQEPHRRRQLGQNAARHIQENFAWPALSQAVERAYNVTQA